MCMVYIYIFLYKSSLKFDHYYFITDGSLCLLYSIHSNATITMSMVWLNFDLLLFHKNCVIFQSNHNHCIKFFVNCSARKGSLIGNKNICICICTWRWRFLILHFSPNWNYIFDNYLFLNTDIMQVLWFD